MLLPRPMRHAVADADDPLGQIGLIGHPAGRQHHAGVDRPCPMPMWMADSLTSASTGKQMMLPSPKAPKRRAMRDRGPMAPSRLAQSHDQRTTSEPAVSRSLRTRVASVAGGGGRSSIERPPTVGSRGRPAPQCTSGFTCL